MSLKLIEQRLKSVIAEAQMSAAARGAVEHGVFPGGKRVRARLVLAVANDCGEARAAGDVSHGISSSSTKSAGIKSAGVKSDSVVADHTLQAAVGIELLHCASLVHDDLPALDNDLSRRGRPTVHAVFGAGVATLAGNVLATLSFSLPLFPHVIAAQAFLRLNDGQILDLSGARTAQELLDLHRKKTGSLFGLCIELGLAPSATFAERASARKLGELVGIEFQLCNDLSDADDQRGASVASDERNKRMPRSLANKIPAILAAIQQQRAAAFIALQKISGHALERTAEVLAEILETSPSP